MEDRGKYCELKTSVCLNYSPSTEFDLLGLNVVSGTAAVSLPLGGGVKLK